MNFHVLSLVVEELSALLTNARVERVYQGRGGEACFLFSGKGKKSVLLLSFDRSLPRLHLVSSKPAADDNPHGFILFLRSHLSGAQVTTIGLLNQDRIVEIRFGKEGNEHRLLFELFGASANGVLLDSASKILAVYHPVTPTESAARTLLPGSLYSTSEKPRISGQREKDALPGWEGEPSPNKAAELYYDSLIKQRHIAALRNELSALINKNLSRTGRLIGALSGDLQSADRCDEYRQAGDLILAHLKILRTGMERAELQGYDGKTVEVTLDPKRSPSRNAELYFKKYKKSRTGRDIISARLRQASEEASYLESRLGNLVQANDIDSLLSIRSEFIARGYIAQQRPPRRKTQQGSALPPIKKIIHHGWEILVGKSAAGNDYLTMKIARPDDLWLHAEGMPGSHVLIRNPNAGDIPPEVLVKAASLAAFHSKGKNAGKVPVTYAFARLVKKPKGAKPGLVTLKERKTLMVKPEDG